MEITTKTESVATVAEKSANDVFHIIQKWKDLEKNLRNMLSEELKESDNLTQAVTDAPTKSIGGKILEEYGNDILPALTTLRDERAEVHKEADNAFSHDELMGQIKSYKRDVNEYVKLKSETHKNEQKMRDTIAELEDQKQVLEASWTKDIREWEDEEKQWEEDEQLLNKQVQELIPEKKKLEDINSQYISQIHRNTTTIQDIKSNCISQTRNWISYKRN
jgi:hypothetical protein